MKIWFRYELCTKNPLRDFTVIYSYTVKFCEPYYCLESCVVGAVHGFKETFESMQNDCNDFCV